MDKNDYIKTLIINENEIELGIDDYSQCYYIEFTNEKSERESICLGTYNEHYMEEIYSMFDPRFEYLLRKDSFYKWGIEPRVGSDLAEKYPSLGKEPLSSEEEMEFKEYQKMFLEENK